MAERQCESIEELCKEMKRRVCDVSEELELCKEECELYRRAIRREKVFEIYGAQRTIAFLERGIREYTDKIKELEKRQREVERYDEIRIPIIERIPKDLRGRIYSIELADGNLSIYFDTEKDKDEKPIWADKTRIPPYPRRGRSGRLYWQGVSISNSRGKLSERGMTMQAMSKTKWKNLINKQLSALGLRNEAYESAVESLAMILEQRDKTYTEFKKSGGKSVVEYTNKAGATNTTKNPLLVMWDELNKTALAYWRELGLTPSSYKKLTGEGPKKEEKKKGLAAALAEIET